MKIAKILSPSFGAKYINNQAKITNTLSNNEEFVSCVKIDPLNSGDIGALESVAKYWKDSKFATNIYYAACAIRNNSKYYKQNQIYALTKQNSDIENLDYNKILGLVHVSPLEGDSLFIEHIETNPEIIYSRTPKYKGIGTAILSYLKTITNKISCFPSNTFSVKHFYFKNGFKEFVESSNLFIWKK